MNVRRLVFHAAIICVVSGLSVSETCAEPDGIDVTQFDYGGRGPDEAWRAEAAERIEKYRKGDLTVTVVDRRDRPVPDVQVDVNMKRHAFRFGSQIQVDIISADGEEADTYRKKFLEMFNFAAVNPFYYSRWRTPDRAATTLDATLKTLSFFQDHDIPMRGHVLVWRMENAPNMTEQEVYDELIEHINRTAGHPTISKALVEWDVQNEPFLNNVVLKKLGREKMPDYFRLTSKHAPHAKLFLNETQLITQFHHRSSMARFEYIIDLVEFLKKEETPIHGLGCQGHNVGSLADINESLKRLDRLAELGLDIEITEFDTKLVPAVTKGTHREKWRAPSATSPELQELEGEFMGDFLTACFSHPSVTAFTMWGFWDGRHWMYNAPLFYEDWTLKPGGKIWKRLVFDEWWTDVDGVTSKGGTFETRGFLGRYEITVRKDGHKSTVITDLVKQGTEIKIRLP